MEKAIIFYLVKVNLALMFGYLLYKWRLSNNTFFALRRFYWIGVILFSFCYPFIKFGDLGITRSSTITTFFASVAEVEVMATPMLEGGRSFWTMSLMEVLVGVMALGTFLFLLQLMVPLFRLFRLKRRARAIKIDGVTVYAVEGLQAPFSFCQWIFLDPSRYDEEATQNIVLHEQCHVEQAHAVDLLMVNLIMLLCWWNPVVFLIRREMVLNLEYQADNAVLCCSSDKQFYQYLLLQQTYQRTAVPIFSNFNVSQLKKRIMMMNKEKSPLTQLLHFLWCIPLFFLFMVGCNNLSTSDDKVVSPEPEVELKAADKQVEKQDEPHVFMVVEEMPEFPGGSSSLMSFISKTINYPVSAQEAGIKGRVVVRFIVRKDGSITDAEVVSAVDPALDAEAIRVINAMPKWKPGKQRGQAVNVKVTVPLNFILQNN